MQVATKLRSLTAVGIAAICCVAAPPADALTSKPLATCAPTVLPKPTVNGIKLSRSIVPVSGGLAAADLKWNVTSPSPDGGPAFMQFNIYEWGLVPFGAVYADTTGCTANSTPLTDVTSFERWGGRPAFKPNTLYTVYLVSRSHLATPPESQDLTALNSRNPLLKPPAAVFWTQAGKLPPA